eukprot:TCALIF_11883-PA protein Name:"Similar to Rab34 Ras-related protein Rab-34 (Mus musculus)" AED:0.27 eAED:0.27 QI:0/0/0/0.66/0.8/0.83/6/0/184
MKFCHNVFDPNYKSTIGVDFELQRFEILRNQFVLQIWDTAGQERFRCIARSYYRDANVICLVFDLTNDKSLENVSDWLEDALVSNQSCNITFPPLIFLVGTKKDLLPPFTLLSKIQCAKWKADEIKAELWILSNKVNYVEGMNAVDFFCRLAALTFESQMLKLMVSDVEPIGSIGTISSAAFQR